jgi:hypothetical protein
LSILSEKKKPNKSRKGGKIMSRKPTSKVITWAGLGMSIGLAIGGSHPGRPGSPGFQGEYHHLPDHPQYGGC